MLSTKINKWGPPSIITTPKDFDENISTALIKRDWSSVMHGILISNFCDSSFTNNNIEYMQGTSPEIKSLMGSNFNSLIGIIKDC